MDWELLVVLLNLILSFLFSASETALTALGRMEVNRIKAKGGPNYELVKRWVRNPSRYLTTVLIGNNISNIAASSLITLWANRNYDAYVASIMAVFTILVIIFLEIIPKIIARQLAIKVAPLSIRFLGFVSLVLYPLIVVVHRLSVRLVGMSGMTGRGGPAPISEKELASTIQIAAREGGIDKETGEVLENLIEFTDTRAKDIMTPRAQVEAVTVGMSMMEVLQLITENRFSRYPVVKDNLDQVLGVLHVKDVLAYIRRGSIGSWTRLIHPPTFESELAPLGSILRDMKRTGTHMILVRDELGLLIGLVTMEDILEEIVGEIRDEDDDPSEAGFERAMGGPQIVSADLAIVDFNQRYKARLPMELSYSTLNGYLIAKTGGKIPDIGTMIVDDDYTYRIHSISDSGVANVELIEHVAAIDKI